ncbi:putative xyloglucan endotransglucosylase/hydrolase protein 5 [Zea mays]|uniref:Putative xyloglucan endotransglucosylase/hydrolase protein 5 n=1 Tax=Zea mays TaxID=4577 RepID=A0A1D6QI86_MAIZE|nr:putative xyloglucan endotransglucosylase/hydrolase protein 5 [Zea mays]
MATARWLQVAAMAVALLAEWATAAAPRKPVDVPGRAVPVQPADEALLQPVERRRLGDPRRAREDGLVQRALRRLLPRLPRRRLRGLRGGALLRHPGRALVGPAGVQGPRRRAVPPPGRGQAPLHHLQLLHRSRPLRRRRAARVRPRPRRLMMMRWAGKLLDREQPVMYVWYGIVVCQVRRRGSAETQRESDPARTCARVGTCIRTCLCCTVRSYLLTPK